MKSVSEKATLVLWVASVLFASAAFWWRIEEFPPYLDFDAATDAIFFNNLTFHGRYDHYFRDASEFQDKMRAWYAAHRLPFSVPVSLIQKSIGVAPAYTDDFVKWLGSIVGLLACLICGAPLRLLCSSRALVFVGAFTAVSPPFFLYMRTGFPIWMTCFSLFWGTLAAVWAYLETGRRAYVYIAAVCSAYFAVNPYTHLLALPLAIIFSLLVRRDTWPKLRSPHPYIAGIAALLLAGAIHLICGLTFDGSFGSYWDKVEKFRAVRPVAHLSLTQMVRELPEKLLKFFDSHVLLLRDSLGDVHRPDDIWELGVLHYPWLACMAFAVFGFAVGMAKRETASRYYGATLAAIWVFFLTFSYPESRYTIVAVPCYAFFVYRGISAIVRDGVPRSLALSSALIAVAAYTFLVCLVSSRGAIAGIFPIAGDHHRYILETRADLDGITEAARIAAQLRVAPTVISPPVHRTYATWLHLALLTNLDMEWREEHEIASMIEQGHSGPIAAFRKVGAETENLVRLGFRVRREFVSMATGVRYQFWIWRKKRS